MEKQDFIQHVAHLVREGLNGKDDEPKIRYDELVAAIGADENGVPHTSKSNIGRIANGLTVKIDAWLLREIAIALGIPMERMFNVEAHDKSAKAVEKVRLEDLVDDPDSPFDAQGIQL